MIINSALNAPDSLSASSIATRSEAPAPTALIVSTIVDSDTPGSKTNALAGSSSTSISVSGVTTASPGVVTTWFSLTIAPPVAVTFFFSSIFTVNEP